MKGQFARFKVCCRFCHEHFKKKCVLHWHLRDKHGLTLVQVQQNAKAYH